MLSKNKYYLKFYLNAKLIFCVALLINSFKSQAQQQIEFSQYVFTGMALNPAYAGYKEETNLHLIYRDQWTGLDGAPKTISASMDGMSSNGRLGFGGEVTQDELGAQSSLSALGVFSYRLLLNESDRLSFGIAGGVDQYQINSNKLIANNNNQDPVYAGLQKSVLQPDFQFGVFYANPKYFLSFSATDLFANFQGSNPAYLVIYRDRHYYFQTGALFNISSGLRLKPSLLIREDFIAPTNIDMNLFLLLSDRFWIGGSLQTGLSLFNQSHLQNNLSSNDSFSILAEFYVSDRLRIGYSFDYSTSLLQQVNNGTHEISIGYTLRSHKAPLLSPRYF